MKHIVKITEKPQLSGKQSIPDGAINGNGDLGIILGNSENGLRVYISKCDLWQGIEHQDNCGLRPLGYIDIPVPAELYENYCVEQDMDIGELRCRFSCGEKVCKINLCTCKTENSILIEISGNVETKPVLKVFEGETAGEKGEFSENGVDGVFRSFSGEGYIFETHCFAAMKNAGQKFYAAIATNHDVENPKAFVIKKASEFTEEKFDSLVSEHRSAWEKFWSKSAFHTDDEELELGWYASQYFLGGCAGNEHFAPGIFANFVTVENPGWHSDYHLNYNYRAPFYAACSSNHVELTDCYHAPLEEFIERGKEFAKKWGCRGIIYPVGIMPGGICSEMDPDNKLWFERLFLGQKSNAIHVADIMVFCWKATRDNAYAAEHAYPFIKECLQFYEDWMIFENGRYSIVKDSAHEVPYYWADFDPKKFKKFINDKNNCLSLGMLRLCLDAAIDMAETLGIDEDKQKQWKDILEKLSPFPTFYRKFQKVFRYTEKGQKWCDGNDVGLQHIYPAGCVGMLKSDAELLKIARNSFSQKDSCWVDNNAVCSYFPMAARLGIDPELIIQKLHALSKEKKLLPNMLFSFGGGCLENCSIFASTLNEMVMQSFEGTIQLFPCWNRGRDVKFETLRADGAFLVSSEMKNGRILYVDILSEAGERLVMKNPYRSSKIEIDGREFKTEDSIISIATSAGSKIRITRV